MFDKFVKLFDGEFQQGLDKNQIRKYEEKLNPYRFSDDFVSLYRAINGDQNDSDYDLDDAQFDFYHYGFNTLEHALEEHIDRKRMYKILSNIEYPEILFPFTSLRFEACTIAGVEQLVEPLCIVLSESKKESSPVVLIDVCDQNHRVYVKYHSIHDYLKTLITQYENKWKDLNSIYSKINPDGYLPGQSGEHSNNGKRNVFDLDHLYHEYS